ncbi:MAG: mechanosensitive ion channel domain-containing protein [Puniceicoccaceae bacterium]
MSYVIALIPFAITLILVIAFLYGANWVLLRRHAELGSERLFPRQLAMLGLTIAGIVVIAMALPVNPSTRNQVIAFLGLVVSGTFAFSSTTIFANLLAGVMLRITKPFRAGDFVEVEDIFGRVSERGLLDTEVQTETRQLISIPNTFLITRPVSVIRSSGTIVSANLSLGYDVHHSRISDHLKEAALTAGLEEPFVHIIELGDFSVSYRVSGLLTDVKSFLTAKSLLHACVLDSLHSAGIEIVSPNFMNQRPLKDGTLVIPRRMQAKLDEKKDETAAEAIVFDKAEEAEQRELKQNQLIQTIQTLEESLKTAVEETKAAIQQKIQAAREQLAELEKAPPPEKE